MGAYRLDQVHSRQLVVHKSFSYFQYNPAIDHPIVQLYCVSLFFGES